MYKPKLGTNLASIEDKNSAYEWDLRTQAIISLKSDYSRTYYEYTNYHPNHCLLVKMTGNFPVAITNQSSMSLDQFPGSYFLAPSSPNLRSKCRIMPDITALISNSARLLPTQLAGPCEKGINAERSRMTLSEFGCPVLGLFNPSNVLTLVDGLRWSTGNQRSGQNSSGNGEKLFLSRWMTYGGRLIAVPGGMYLRMA